MYSNIFINAQPGLDKLVVSNRATLFYSHSHSHMILYRSIRQPNNSILQSVTNILCAFSIHLTHSYLI